MMEGLGHFSFMPTLTTWSALMRLIITHDFQEESLADAGKEK
jgi:hypothetical protein